MRCQLAGWQLAKLNARDACQSFHFAFRPRRRIRAVNNKDWVDDLSRRSQEGVPRRHWVEFAGYKPERGVARPRGSRNRELLCQPRTVKPSWIRIDMY